WTRMGVREWVLKATNTAGTEPSNAHGIDGGYPGAGSQVRVLRGTSVWERLKSGRIPREDADFGGQVEHLPSKASGTLGTGDVLVFFAPGGGGFGDPLDREPERVARAVANGFVSRACAHDMYGVAIAEDGGIDGAATAAQRERIRGARKQRPTGEWVPDDQYQRPGNAGTEPSRIGETVELAADGALQCRR